MVCVRCLILRKHALPLPLTSSRRPRTYTWASAWCKTPDSKRQGSVTAHSREQLIVCCQKRTSWPSNAVEMSCILVRTMPLGARLCTSGVSPYASLKGSAGSGCVITDAFCCCAPWTCRPVSRLDVCSMTASEVSAGSSKRPNRTLGPHLLPLHVFSILRLRTRLV